MPKKNNPGCNCCGASCSDYLIDFFNRANGGLGTDWTVSSGTWSIVSNQVQAPTDGVALAVNSPANLTGLTTFRASIFIPGASDGDTFQVYLLASSVSNCYIAELEINYTSQCVLRLIEVSGGTPTTHKSCNVGLAAFPCTLNLRYLPATGSLTAVHRTTTGGGTENTPSITVTEYGYKGGMGVKGCAGGSGTLIDDFALTSCDTGVVGSTVC